MAASEAPSIEGDVAARVLSDPRVQNGDDWFDPEEFSETACKILRVAKSLAEKAGPLGGSGVGARHVACALFCEHPIGSRLFWGAGRSEDIWDVLEGIRLLVANSGPATADDQGLFLSCVRSHRPDVSPRCVEDLLNAFFNPNFDVAQVFDRNGLAMSELQTALPKALKVISIYDRKSSSGRPAFRMPLSPTEIRGAPPAAFADSSGEAKYGDGGELDSQDADTLAAARSSQAEIVRLQAPAPNPKRIALAAYGVDMVEQARRGKLDPVFGRDEEIRRVLQVLSRRTKNNVCLIGAPGVGKTSVAEAVAQRLAEGSVPAQLRRCKELWSLDIGALLAGTSMRGDFEERLRALLQEIRESAGAALLFIDELHLVLGAGRSESNNVDAANLLKPMLARGEIRCIGATTTDEYRTLILAKDAAFERRFQPVELLEPSHEAALEMLRGLAPLYSQHHRISVSMPVLDACVRLSHLQIHSRSLPDKAIDVLDEACCLATGECAKEVSQAHVAAVVKRWQARSVQPGPVNRALRWAQRHFSRL